VVRIVVILGLFVSDILHFENGSAIDFVPQYRLEVQADISLVFKEVVGHLEEGRKLYYSNVK
jgi:hypothetical protein